MNFLRTYSTSQLSEPFRLAMSRISSQAMILTSGTKTDSNELHGMTLGSVCSLSVFPTPLIQFNLHLPSYTSSELHRYKYLALHVLPPIDASVHLSRIFAKGIKGEDGEVFHEMTKPFELLEGEKEYGFYNVDEEGVKIPILKNVETTLICKVRENFLIEGHEIWVANVVDILQNNQFKEKSGGILYYNRGFHKIGKRLHE
ncbi:hypothetical protein SBY92_001925 [Candida maltosa Xu316]